MARKKQSLLNGALILTVSMAITEVLGLLYKIPLTNIIGTVGKAYYSSAYNLFIPIYSISLAGLPVAISRTVSSYAALGRYRDVRRARLVGQKIFVITGVVGTVLSLALAYPYAASINRPQTIWAMLIISPAVFFCCLMSSYRGYFNGLRNMTPQAVSEVIESAAKMVLGILFAQAVKQYGLMRAAQGKSVFGMAVTPDMTQEDVLLNIYPISASAAILGVTIGTVLATAYLALLYKKKGDGITVQELRVAPPPESPKAMTKALLAIALPIVAGTLIFNITNFIDSWSIQNRLDYAVRGGGDVIYNMFRSSLDAAGYAGRPEVWPTYLYGAYEIAVDFKNMIPTVTTVLGISAIPVLAEAWTLKDEKNIKTSIETVLRMTMLISLPAGLGMAAIAKHILRLMYYGSASWSSADISSTVMIGYGATVFIIAVSQPMMNLLQTIGRADIPVKSIAVGAVLKVVVNFLLVGIPSINIYGAIIGTVICYAVSGVINFIMLRKYSGVKISLVSIFLKPLLCAGVTAVSAFFIQKVLAAAMASAGLLTEGGRFNNDTVAAIAAVACAVVFYVLLLFITRSIRENDIKMLPKGEKIAKVLAKLKLLR